MSGTRFAVSLGSNIGDRLAYLQGAVDGLAATPGVTVEGVSCVVETDPVGGPEQADYLNAVVVGRTTLSPQDLLVATSAIESHANRTREVHWGPRTLDVDIIVVGQCVFDEPDLTLPHPRAHERAFVLVPWTDIEPEACIPCRGSVRELMDGLDVSGVRSTSLHLVLPPSAGVAQ